MAEQVYDNIVIGAGHNGLVTAALLAKRSEKVLLLESRSSIGGTAASAEITSGFTCPTVAHIYRGLNPAIVKTLKLKRHGLKLCPDELPTVALSPERERHVIIGEGFSTLNYSDGSDHPERDIIVTKLDQLKRFGKIMQQLMRKSPPNLHGTIHDLLITGQTALSIRRLGRRDMQELMRIALSNIYDVLLDEIQDGPAAAAIAMEALLGSHAGPRSPGNVMLLLQRLAGEIEGKQAIHTIPLGGMGSISKSLATAAVSLGVEIQTNAAVKRILLENDQACGIELQNGITYRSKRVFSSIAPQTTLLQMVGVRDLDAETIRAARQYRCKGSNAKLNLALSSLPRFAGLTEQQQDARLLIAPSLEDLERGFNSQKYAELPDSPVMEITLPSQRDSSLCKAEGHILSATLQYVPYHLKAGWDKASETLLQNKIMDTLEHYAPGIKQQVVAQQLLTPKHLEKQFGLPGGHWHHGELCVDQMLMMRPFVGSSRYASPVPGLYFCGAGCHPGGDITAYPAHNAVAQEHRDRRHAL